MVRLDILMTVTTFDGASFSRTTSAASIAAPILHPPCAIPTSDLASDGASLMPVPYEIVLPLEPDIVSSNIFNLSSGNSSEWTDPIPAWFAISFGDLLVVTCQHHRVDPHASQVGMVHLESSLAVSDTRDARDIRSPMPHARFGIAATLYRRLAYPVHQLRIAYMDRRIPNLCHDALARYDLRGADDGWVYLPAVPLLMLNDMGWSE